MQPFYLNSYIKPLISNSRGFSSQISRLNQNIHQNRTPKSSHSNHQSFHNSSNSLNSSNSSNSFNSFNSFALSLSDQFISLLTNFQSKSSNLSIIVEEMNNVFK
jgi:hypothetical protein